MTKTFLLTSFLVLQFTDCIGKQKVVYVSSSEGDDNNDGLTSEAPVKTIAQGSKLSETLLLKCGDVFYETIKITRSKISSYGKGKKPIICGWKRIITPNWEFVGKNIWKISLKDENFSGYKIGEDYLLNNIGCIHEYDKDSIHGRKVQFKSQLKDEWDIWQTSHYREVDIEKHDFDSLYLKCCGDPNELKLEFSVGITGVAIEKSTIEHIRIEGFGKHGIVPKSHTKIQDCEIDAIGGMTQITDNEFVSLGNGIEFWLYKDIEDCLVKKCLVTRCYDCAMSIQGQKKGRALPRQIFFKNNVIIDCCQGWEDFLNNESVYEYDRCYFQNNIVINSGKTAGFNYPSRMKYCHVLGNNVVRERGMVIKKNLFVGGNYYCSGSCNGSYKSNKWIDNICILKQGDYILSDYLGREDVLRIPVEGNIFEGENDTNVIIDRYRQLTGDSSTKFVVMDQGDIENLILQYKSKYLNR